MERVAKFINERERESSTLKENEPFTSNKEF